MVYISLSHLCCRAIISSSELCHVVLRLANANSDRLADKSFDSVTFFVFAAT